MNKTDDIYTITFTCPNKTKLRIISAPAKSPTLHEARDFVGGHVVMAPINNPNEKVKPQLLVNEDGETLGLAPNENATRVAGYTIYGNAILLKGEARWS